MFVACSEAEGAKLQWGHGRAGRGQTDHATRPAVVVDPAMGPRPDRGQDEQLIMWWAHEYL
jgi:hypothetical protein